MTADGQLSSFRAKCNCEIYCFTAQTKRHFELVLLRQVAFQNGSDGSRWTFHQAIHVRPTDVGLRRSRDACLPRSRRARRFRAEEPAPMRLLWAGRRPDLAARRRDSIGGPSPCLRSRRAAPCRRTPRWPGARQVVGRGDAKTVPPGRQRSFRPLPVRCRPVGVGGKRGSHACAA